MKYGIGKKLEYCFIAIYKTNKYKDDWVKILDEDFIKNNKDKAKIIYKNKISKS